MNRFALAFSISIMLHLIGALCLRHLRLAEGPPIKVVQVFLPEPAASVRPSPSDVPAKRGGSKALPYDKSVLLPLTVAADEPQIVAIVDTAAGEYVKVDFVVGDSVEDLDRINFFTQDSLLPPFNAEASALPGLADSSGFFKASPFFDKTKNPSLYLNRPGPFDKAQMDTDKRNMGGERPFSLSEAVQVGSQYLSDVLAKKEKNKPVRLDFVPSKTELEILSAVWQKPKVNDVEIYASMDSSIKVSAEELQQILEGLVQKKLLTRNITSPRNEFTLPFGGTVEMSAKNLRNRVYEYYARIEADEVIRYLNALLYELEHSPAGLRTSAYEKRVADLKEKILLTGR